MKAREGQIVRIDHFGNIVTNLPKLVKDDYEVIIGMNKKKMKLFRTYDAAPQGELFLIVGSANTLEISLKDDRALNKFDVSVGDKITIR